MALQTRKPQAASATTAPSPRSSSRGCPRRLGRAARRAPARAPPRSPATASLWRDTRCLRGRARCPRLADVPEAPSALPPAQPQAPLGHLSRLGLSLVDASGVDEIAASLLTDLAAVP